MLQVATGRSGRFRRNVVYVSGVADAADAEVSARVGRSRVVRQARVGGGPR
jgi:hypothetical protein